jgi:hypothetical protein
MLTRLPSVESDEHLHSGGRTQLSEDRRFHGDAWCPGEESRTLEKARQRLSHWF